MDTKRLILAMLVSMAVLFGWEYIQRKYFPAPPKPVATTQSTTQPTNLVDSTTAPTTQGTSITAAPTTAGGLKANEAVPREILILGSHQRRDPTYKIGLAVNTQGAGLDSVTLNEFSKAVKDESPFVYQAPYPDKPETRPLAFRSVTINGKTVDLSRANWFVESKSVDSVTLFIDLADEYAVARVRRTYSVSTYEQSKDTSGGYVVDVKTTVENLTNAPLTFSAVINGPTDPPKDIDRAGDRQIIAGYTDDGIMKVQHFPIENYTAEKPTHDLTNYDSKPEEPVASWFGTNNVYFNAVLIPRAVDANGKPTQIAKFDSQAVLLPDKHYNNEIALTVQTNSLTIEPNGKVEIPMQAAFVPRVRNLLKNEYYTALPLGLDQTLVLSSGPCGFCTFPWLVDGLVHLLRFFYMILRDWGLAIIALVILVRAILHPITKKAQVNMMKMGKLGPEIERLKKKYGDNKDEFAKAQMQLYKQMGFTPVLGCLPLFLQMPIFIALFMALQTTFELRNAPFLYGFTWIKDLSKPDALVQFDTPINLFFFSMGSLNLLPLLVAVVQYLSFKYTPRPPAMTPEQEQQQKMMQWMTLIFPLMFYTMPSGLNLYYLTSTGLGILEGKITRDHIKRQEELEKAQGPVIIDAPIGKRKGKELPRSQEPVKKKGLSGWLANIMQQAEQMRQEIEKKKQK